MNRQPPTPTTGLLDFGGRTVVITGTSSGMGAEAKRLFLAAGAAVHALDVVEPAEIGHDGSTGVGAVVEHRCDLADPASIDATIAALPDRIDVLVNCAGVPNGGRFDAETVMRVNWFGLRYLTESVLPRMDEGTSVVHVASTAGRNWPDHRQAHEELMAATSFADGLAWLGANPDAVGDGYAFSKEAVQFYTMWRSVQLLPRGIRMNSVCPGITDTAIIDDFRKGMGTEMIDHAAAVAGRFASPAEMAPAMLFLADEASSSYLNGINLNLDRGTGAARTTGQADPEAIWGTGSGAGSGLPGS
jgi:NAD(P)-dependent dehydrogenase (short-subunit alcohol dehydrogenase family)